MVALLDKPSTQPAPLPAQPLLRLANSDHGTRAEFGGGDNTVSALCKAEPRKRNVHLPSLIRIELRGASRAALCWLGVHVWQCWRRCNRTSNVLSMVNSE